jgi:hypothetical protein
LPAATRGQGGEPAPQFDEPQMPLGTTLNPDEEAEERMHQQNGEPTYVDARSLRISGKDANGKMFGASLWLPQGEERNGGPRVEPEMAAAADRALRTLNVVDQEHCAGLALLQRRLNQHYARR